MQVWLRRSGSGGCVLIGMQDCVVRKFSHWDLMGTFIGKGLRGPVVAFTRTTLGPMPTLPTPCGMRQMTSYSRSRKRASLSSSSWTGMLPSAPRSRMP